MDNDINTSGADPEEIQPIYEEPTTEQTDQLSDDESGKAIEVIRELIDHWIAVVSGDLNKYTQLIEIFPELFGDSTSKKDKPLASKEKENDEKLLKLFDESWTAARALYRIEKSATIQRTDKIEFPLDKINSYAWNLLEQSDPDGQIAFDLSRSGSEEQLPVFYSINFDELGSDIQITRRLTPFDKRVYITVSALFAAGNEIITISQIYKHMGYTTNPGGSVPEKIRNSIIKMLGAQIYLDNAREVLKYKKYSKFVYRGSLLPVETGELYNIQGALTDAAIHIFREPPLMTFARERKQITTIDLKLLQSPANKTDANLMIEDYLVERISRAKHAKKKWVRILFETLYNRTRITTKKQIQRAPAKIENYLKYQEEVGFFKRYTMDDRGITIYLK